MKPKAGPWKKSPLRWPDELCQDGHLQSLPLVADRPQHSGMLDSADLTPGRVVLRHYQNGGAIRYRVVDSPRDGQVTMKSLGFSPYGDPAPSIMYLADMGMEPYQRSGLWNPTNYVTATEPGEEA